MQKKIKEKQALLEMLDRIEFVLGDKEDYARDALNTADLTPDENGVVDRWQKEQADEAQARLNAIEVIRAALGKLI